jgi:hypothetical protein
MRTYKNINKREKKMMEPSSKPTKYERLKSEKKKLKSIRVCMLRLQVGLLDWDKHIESK